MSHISTPAMSLSADEIPMPLFGSDGNDGSRDFGVNFADELARLFDVDSGFATELGTSSLEGALLGGGRLGTCGTMGQFSPGQGGSNATTGYEGLNPLNPWDVVLTMEGTIVFAGALTRSWGRRAVAEPPSRSPSNPLELLPGTFRLKTRIVLAVKSGCHCGRNPPRSSRSRPSSRKAGSPWEAVPREPAWMLPAPSYRSDSPGESAASSAIPSFNPTAGCRIRRLLSAELPRPTVHVET